MRPHTKTMQRCTNTKMLLTRLVYEIAEGSGLAIKRIYGEGFPDRH